MKSQMRRYYVNMFKVHNKTLLQQSRDKCAYTRMRLVYWLNIF